MRSTGSASIKSDTMISKVMIAVFEKEELYKTLSNTVKHNHKPLSCLYNQENQPAQMTCLLNNFYM